MELVKAKFCHLLRRKIRWIISTKTQAVCSAWMETVSRFLILPSGDAFLAVATDTGTQVLGYYFLKLANSGAGTVGTARAGAGFIQKSSLMTARCQTPGGAAAASSSDGPPEGQIVQQTCEVLHR